MRRLLLVLTVVLLLTIGGSYGHSVLAWPSQGETPTPSETPSETASPEVTGTPTDPASTEAATDTATPNVYAQWQLSSGQAVEIKFSMSAGEILIIVLLLVVIGLLTFGLFLALVKK